MTAVLLLLLLSLEMYANTGDCLMFLPPQLPQPPLDIHGGLSPIQVQLDSIHLYIRSLSGPGESCRLGGQASDSTCGGYRPPCQVPKVPSSGLDPAPRLVCFYLPIPYASCQSGSMGFLPKCHIISI
ncbi:hypothetical protein F5Y18DRAFT_343278 [Xylariaceae sp. FL1019]|nr:hypothetical protein F5Y18DRAFT_343278 [Xylariaceae sp. FL1019]